MTRNENIAQIQPASLAGSAADFGDCGGYLFA
jgi:hypothetical protein